MAETKKTEAAATAAPPKAACLTLRQKLVEMRKACPEIVKKQHSDGVSYKYAKIYDVWEKITPIMNELGVDFDVISEQATRHACLRPMIAPSEGASLCSAACSKAARYRWSPRRASPASQAATARDR